MFTFNYLATTLLIALGDRSGLALTATGSALQIALIAVGGAGEVGELLAVKVIVQSIIALSLIVCTALRLRASHTSPVLTHSS